MNLYHLTRVLLTFGFVFVVINGFLSEARALDVKASSENGFKLEIKQEISATEKEVTDRIVEVSRWWDSNHTYTANSKNLSIDLDRGVFLEKLPDGGFVKHMNVVYYQPGKTLRMTGGLGPLQGMGVNGALTFSVKKSGKKTILVLHYNVSGFSGDDFKTLAPIVDKVLKGQIKGLKESLEKPKKE